jgi:hypothetical protein
MQASKRDMRSLRGKEVALVAIRQAVSPPLPIQNWLCAADTELCWC